MARGRMISKSLSTSEKFASLADHAGQLAEFCQALYPLVLTHSDDFGRLQGDAFTVKHMCFPSSPRSVRDFTVALDYLHNVGLICRYEAASKLYIQIENFDPHQSGLHKRTASGFPDIPDDSRKFREIPGQEKGRELKGSEENRTEGNRIPVTNNKLVIAAVSVMKANGKGGVSARSNRPIFRGQRFVVFDWMLDDISQMLGPAFEDFGLDEFFDRLDKIAARQNVVLPKPQVWPWIQSRVIAEAASRGLAVVSQAPKPHKRDVRDAEAIALMRSVQ